MRSADTARLAALLLASALMCAPSSLAAQRVHLTGRGELVTDTILYRVVNSPDYRLVDADTVLPASDTLRGNVIIAATTIKLENVIVGDVVIVDANVFMRPGSHITGDVINIAGALFRASTARIDGQVREFKDALYYATRRADGVQITGERVASLFDLDGFGGFRTPDYNRVAGLSAEFGARYLLPRIGTTEPDIHGWVGYQTAREKLIGGADAGFRNGRFRFTAGVERTVRTNDAWVRGWTNGVAYLTRGSDYRDYYAADRFFAEPGITFSGEDRSLGLTLTAQIEDARSLPSLDAFHFDGDSARPNPSIDDGRIASLILRADARLDLRTLVLRTDAAIETATDVLDGEHSFGRVDFGGVAAMQAIASHTLRVRWRARGPLPGTDSLPAQRWNVLGGRASLFTLDQADHRGDRLAYVETEYDIPMPRWTTVRILGRPSIELVHRAGRAWLQGGESDLVQNVGIRLRTRIAFAMYVVDPSHSSDGLFLAGLSIRRSYPWTPQ